MSRRVRHQRAACQVEQHTVFGHKLAVPYLYRDAVQGCRAIESRAVDAFQRSRQLDALQLAAVLESKITDTFEFAVFKECNCCKTHIILKCFLFNFDYIGRNLDGHQIGAVLKSIQANMPQAGGQRHLS